MITLTHQEVQRLTRELADRLNWPPVQGPKVQRRIYAVPRGGIPVVYLLKQFIHFEQVDKPEDADTIVDDLVDSGKTKQKLLSVNPTAHFDALITKGQTPGYPLGSWLVFPWETDAEGSIEDAFVRLLQYIGENPERGGLVETPRRMAKAWQEYSEGYRQDPADIVKLFEDGAEGYDEMVMERRIPFFSHCEHHLAPFFGHVDFGYIPGTKVVGLSKMNRLVNLFSRRLQVQERLGSQILKSFVDGVAPIGAGVRIVGVHTCVCGRGVRHTGCDTVTINLHGKMKSEIATRAEFMANVTTTL